MSSVQSPVTAPVVSVLVVSYEVREQLARCLDSVRSAAADVPVEILVADNASRDGSADMVREQYESVELIAWESNKGFSAGVNACAQRARAPRYLLLNPDAQLPPDSIPRMLASARARGADVLGVRQVDSDGFFQWAWGPSPSLGADLVRRTLQKRLDRRQGFVAELLDRSVWRARSVPWVAGSCMLVEGKTFEQVGGFDERFFLFFEDIDFCLRVRAAGGKVVYDPEITVVHERGSSARVAGAEAERAYRDSQRRFWRKHRGWLAGEVVNAYLKRRGD